MTKHNTAAFWIFVLYTACGSNVQCPNHSIQVETAGNCLTSNVDTGAKWNNALERCQAMGGTLAEIESEAKDKFIEKFISIAYTDMTSIVWLGATSDGDEWTWAGSGSRVEYTHWYSYPKERCAAIVTLGTINGWLAYRCDMSYNYMCEIQTVE